MLTRLKVKGFKNLADVDVSFGPFTCIAGANGVGKSNLFDAIRFLSALADKPFVEAAREVRDEGGRTGDVRSLFHRVGDKVADRMSFEAEMIVPRTGVDELGGVVETKRTFLRYTLELGMRRGDNGGPGEFGMFHESLIALPRTENRSALSFPYSGVWRDSAIIGAQLGRGGPRIATQDPESTAPFGLRTGSPPASVGHMRGFPRTALSVQYGGELVLARREMQSWRVFHFEPTALRTPAQRDAPTTLGSKGEHLPAVLDRLERMAGPGPRPIDWVGGRLRDLVREVRSVEIDRDEKRELLSLLVTDKYGTRLPARALSDGTLRFLALCALEADPETTGAICIEEPENGLHPERIPTMLRLLRDIAVSTDFPVGPDNPLRQVIVSTHSPGVVGGVAADDLLVADAGRNGLRFWFPPGTWRAQQWDREHGPARPPTLGRGQIAAYLHPIRRPDDEEPPDRPRVADHPAYNLFRDYEPVP